MSISNTKHTLCSHKDYIYELRQVNVTRARSIDRKDWWYVCGRIVSRNVFYINMLRVCYLHCRARRRLKHNNECWWYERICDSTVRWSYFVRQDSRRGDRMRAADWMSSRSQVSTHTKCSDLGARRILAVVVVVVIALARSLSRRSNCLALCG